MDESVKEPMEREFGADFSGVRVHTDTQSDELNQAIQAKAFTTGEDIFFREGAYEPGSKGGQELLAHELTHVVQQSGGAVQRKEQQEYQPTKLSTVSVNKVTEKKIQGVIYNSQDQQQRWDALCKIPTIKSASAVVQKVIETVAKSSDQNLEIKYTSINDLIKKAKNIASNPPLELINEVDEYGFKLLQSYINTPKNKVTLQPNQEQAINQRKSRRSQQYIASLGSNPHLHIPTHDPNYKIPSKMDTEKGETTGRDSSKWHPVQNSLPGYGSKTTGSVNIELGQEALNKGAYKEIIKGYSMQMCLGCGSAEDVESFEVDHQQAYSDIRDTLHNLAEAMTYDPQFKITIENNTPKFKTFFIEENIGQKNYRINPTQAVLNYFSNDVSNLIRICRKCNGATGKSAMDYIEWYKSNELFGEAFLAENLPTVSSGNILARTKHNTGWGEAARQWFYNHHLAILQKQFVVDKLSKLINNKLSEQTKKKTAAQFETDTNKKRKLADEAESLDRLNDAFVGSTGALGIYLENEPTPFAPDSPNPFIEGIQEQIVSREKRKRQEHLEDQDSYNLGYDDALECHLRTEYKFEDQEKQLVYNYGYKKGYKMAKQKWEEGYEAGIAEKAEEYSAYPTYNEGYQKGKAMLEDIFNQGKKDGLNLAPPNHESIKKGIKGEASMLRKYMEGYSKGLQERQQN